MRNRRAPGPWTGEKVRADVALLAALALLAPPAFLAAPALLATPATAGVGFGLRYEGQLSADRPLVRPSAVAYDAASTDLCVTDESVSALALFDRFGMERFRTDESAGLSQVRDGSLDPAGRLVYLEANVPAGPAIRRLNFFGEPDEFRAVAPHEGWAPLHLLVTTEGDYVTIDGRGFLCKHAESGELLWSVSIVDSAFERVDQVGRPAEGPNGTIYVPSTGERQILLVSASGEPEGTLGVPGAKRGELAFPVAVGVTADGHVLVLDRMRHVILLYGPDHRFIDEFGGLGRRPGDLYHPLALSVAPDGRVFVAQGFEGRVQQFRLVDLELTRKNSDS